MKKKGARLEPPKPAAGGGEADESSVRWLISYADFMMQLVCLFILLFSTAALDQSKMAAAASSYRQSKGLEEPRAPRQTPPLEDPSVRPILDEVFTHGDPGLGDVPLRKPFRVFRTHEGLRLDFTIPLFEKGEAAIEGERLRALGDAAEFLGPYVGTIEVTAVAGPDPDDAAAGDAMRLALQRADRAVALLGRTIEPRRLVARARVIGESERALALKVSLLLRVK